MRTPQDAHAASRYFFRLRLCSSARQRRPLSPSTPRSDLCQPSATQAGPFPLRRGARWYKNVLAEHAKVQRRASYWLFSRGAVSTGSGFGHVSDDFTGHDSRVVPAAQLRAPTSWCVSIISVGSG